MRIHFWHTPGAPALVILATAMLTHLHATAQSTNAATQAVNQLGIDLLRRTGDSGANALLSPYSIQSALAMTYAGARGRTRDEMAAVLHYPSDDAELHRSFAALRGKLDEMAERSARQAEAAKQHGGSIDPFTLTVANRLFGQSGYEFREPFLELVREQYAAPLESLNFAQNPPGATRHINQWVEDKTRQRIRDLIPDGALDELTRLVVVNAVYLKAAWSKPFSESATQSKPFRLADGKEIEVPTMTQRDQILFEQRPGCTVVALRYSPWTLQFVMLVPDEPGGLQELERRLSSGLLDDCTRLRPLEIILSMPKFKMEPPLLPLGTHLKELGMKSAFDVPPGSANFEGMAPRRGDDSLAISEVFHKTFLDLDEKGTEAAAATAVMMGLTGMARPVTPVEVKVDRPFLFAIQETTTGACLFLGRLTDPR